MKIKEREWKKSQMKKMYKVGKYSWIHQCCWLDICSLLKYAEIVPGDLQFNVIEAEILNTCQL
jgi:hypothetical protein